MSEASVAWQHITLPMFHQRQFKGPETPIHATVYQGENLKTCPVHVTISTVENKHLREDLGWGMLACCVKWKGWERRQWYPHFSPESY